MHAPSKPAKVFHSHRAAIVGGVLLLLMVFLAVFAPFIATADPTAIFPGRRALPPSASFWFGTDMLGRDLFARVIYGARVSLAVGFSVGFLSTLAGTMLGLFSGTLRWLDPILSRVIEGLMSIPTVILAIALMALTRGSMLNVIVAISIAETPRVARLARGLVLSIREQPYVEAATLSGSRTPRIMLRHILPNILAPIVVQASFIVAAAMILESVLSFIGAGTPPITPSWGNIMADGRVLWQVKPHIIFIPAAFLSLTVLSVNLVGDALRDALDSRKAHQL